ncbi:MAG: tryptophan 2,3-dioxygenase, partial [Alphaproteobacteria bacterium]|nr:tryptophan 2,3-dioxygenase [Alphaproteobacteria bacterium]
GEAPEGAHLDLAGEMSYGDYLVLDQLLAAQRPLSGNHNEILFIIQHQTTELWMKLVLHELGAAREHIRRDSLQPAFKMLARVSRIMGQLIQAWDVLSTLTPSEYMDFRDKLGKSSGFQSHQYRMIEFALGNKNAAMTAPFRHKPDVHAEVIAALEAPSLYDESLRLLARRDFALDPQCLERDWRTPYAPNASVAAAWTAVYRDTTRYWDLYELAEELVDLEDYFRQWRFRHVTTVERIIGFKAGTGGTAGVQYLRRMLEVRLFPELWDLRTSL